MKNQGQFTRGHGLPTLGPLYAASLAWTFRFRAMPPSPPTPAPPAPLPVGAPMSPPRRRVVAVDGHSMFYAQQKVGWFFDPRRLLDLAAADPGVELSGAFWYAGLKDPADQRPFRDALTSLGFTVRTRPLRELPGGGEADGRQYMRANLDVEIAIDLMAVSHRCEEVWLLSGSRDVDRLVEVLRARGAHVTVISTEGMVARELRNAADRFVDLVGLRSRLEKADAAQAPVFARG
jgi:uncharacterized LabA/DUF88 family protein